MSDGTAGSDFAEQLRELKDRSGLSYGTLAKRLHMSTSTLHRYCNGDAVPADYAPVERLARLCKAAPDELVELHRRWVLADASRGRKTDAAEKPAGTVATADSQPESEPESRPQSESRSEPGREAESERGTESEPEPESRADVMPDPEVVLGPGVAGLRGHRARRPALLAGIAVVVLAGAAALAVQLPSGGTDDKHPGVAGAATVAGAAPHRTGHSSTKPTAAPATTSPSSSSPSSSPSSSARTGGTAGGAAPAGPSAAADDGTDTPPLTVNTKPYSWESPCSQHYLIDRGPADVAPPPLETDATAWVTAHQAVSSGEQYVTLTLQGTGTESVVLEGLTVRTTQRSSPLAWNDYAMGYPGVGCGGGVPTRSFTVALDAMRPAVVPQAGHRGFPFKVSESDPEVFYITADASAYSVGWYLELSWSSGSRHGTLRIDDRGRPFRTSGNNGRPAYEFPLGGEAWRTASSPAG
ncbi:helix-turn-helix domain-containing protein [Streptomyces sp. NPDC093970]|uniref:helix-turn-helix domain-containing protein n=1 Tax=Streptomyces sp. NPDC093970 TaxID=3155076 RepID=UPI0034307666